MVKYLVEKLGFKQEQGVRMLYDSQSVIYLARNQVYHVQTKYIDVRYHKIREWLTSGVVDLQKVHTKENAADMLTKINPKVKFERSLDLINVSSC